jgi:hypothetical protein
MENSRMVQCLPIVVRSWASAPRRSALGGAKAEITLPEVFVCRMLPPVMFLQREATI